MNQLDPYLVLAGAVGTSVVLRDGSRAPIKLASVHRAGSTIVLSGRALDGSAVTRTVSASGGNPLLPAWAIRLAGALSVMAWRADQRPTDWNPVITGLIEAAGLPVDPKMNWNPVLYNLFTHDKGMGRGDSEFRDELIQQALFTIVRRRSLEKFDPDAAQTDDPDKLRRPLAEKVSIYMVQLLKWQAGDKEVGAYAKNIKDPAGLTLDLSVDNRDANDSEASPIGSDFLVDPNIQQDQADGVRSLTQLRGAFATWVQKRRGGALPHKILLLFDLLTQDRDPSDTIAVWEEVTNTGYGSMKKTREILRTDLTAFANSEAQRHNPALVSLVNDLRVKDSALPATEAPAEPLQADPDLIPAEPEAVPAGVGPKAQAMHSGPPAPRSSAHLAALFTQAMLTPAALTPGSGSVYALRTAQTLPAAPSKELRMPTPKNAALARRATLTTLGTLKRLAAEAPEQVSTAVESIKQKLLDQVACLENFQEQLDMSPEGAAKFDEPEAEVVGDHDKGTEEKEPKDQDKKDGDDDADDQGKPTFAGLKQAAEDEPEEIENALQDFFLGLDEIMAETEGLASTLGVELIAPQPDGDGDLDDGVEVEEEQGPKPGEELVEFSGTADPETAKVMFDAGAEDSGEEDDEKPFNPFGGD
jgi:hypothetical protein